MIVNGIDFFVVGIQAYMLSNFVCRYLPIKYDYRICMTISILGLYIHYFVINHFVFDVTIRLLIGITGVTMIGLCIFDASILWRIVFSVIEYAVFALLDMLSAIVFYPWMELLVSNDLLISNRLLLGRSLYNVTFYLVIICLEYLLEKKTEAKKIYLLAVFLGVSQICIMYCMYENDPIYIARKAMVLSVIYNGVVILGYLVMKELFRKLMIREKKQSELEQIAMESRYQYELYRKAVEKNESIRDLRHDMRNQLQTARLLLNVSKESNKEKAETILGRLKEKVE